MRKKQIVIRFPDSSAMETPGCTTNRGMITDSLGGPTVPCSIQKGIRRFDLFYGNSPGPRPRDHFTNPFATSER
jgi:hypothetical protein